MSANVAEKPYDFVAHASAFLYDSVLAAAKAGVDISNAGINANKPTPRFLFHSADGVALQLYLREGMILPKDKAAYEIKYPRKDIETYLNGLDNQYNLYQAAEDNALSVYTNTTDFHDNTFNDMFTLTGKIKAFGEEAQDKVSYLRDQVTIITKVGSKVTDPDVEEAIKTAQAIAGILADKAKTAGVECGKMHQALLKFGNATEIDRNKAVTVNEKFTKLVPKINKELATLKADITKLQGETSGLEKKYWHLTTIAATTPSYAYATIFGFIAAITVSSIYGPKAVAAKDKWNTNLADISKKQATEGNLITMLNSVQTMDSSMAGVRKTIDAAITACEKMRGAFSVIQGDFGGIKQKLGDFQTNIGNTEDFYRKIGGRDLKQAEDKWKEVIEQTKVFQTTGTASFKE